MLSSLIFNLHRRVRRLRSERRSSFRSEPMPPIRWYSWSDPGRRCRVPCLASADLKTSMAIRAVSEDPSVGPIPVDEG